MGTDGLTHATVRLDKALFVLSLDTELGWGFFDAKGFEAYSEQLLHVRGAVKRLLALLDKYSIKATWAIVGHLFLKSCSRDGDDSHDHVLQPQYDWYPSSWLSHDPYSNVDSAPLFYAPDIIDDIASARQAHEIGCHTFSHAIFGDPQCTTEVARSQLIECQRLAATANMNVVSLVFPRNSIGHLDVLYDLGFTSFRGVERRWYRIFDPASVMVRACHFCDRLLAFTPPCYCNLECYTRGDGDRYLFEIPSSMFYPPFGGLWGAIGLSRRVLQAKRGIAEAVRRKALFHLWFHPENLVSSSSLFEGLEEILAYLDRHRKQGLIECYTMGETATHLSRLVDL
jgi:peptidoglycan/xylan/chitin deacetylase (PgdA/CDA1 family)